MRQFKWRLQRVLEIRTKEEQIKRSELMKVTEKLSQTRAELLIKKQILKDTIEQIKKHRRDEVLKIGSGLINDKEIFLRYSDVNGRMIKNIESRIQNLEKMQQKKIAEIINLKKAKEGLEKLKARDKEKYIKEAEKLEQKEIDDQAGIKFAASILKNVSGDNQ